jgi:hypothetical protein
MDQVKDTPFTDCCPRRDSQRNKTTEDAPVCETRQKTRVCACSGLVLHKINDYLYQFIYEQLINAIIDEVNDG